MNLIEGGRPRIGCIRRQPSARSLILSLEEGHPSMGKIAGSSGKRGDGRQEHRGLPGTGVRVAAPAPKRFHPRPWLPGCRARASRWSPKSLHKLGGG